MTTREWFEANQRDMVAALERVRLALAYRAGAESVMPPIDGDEQRSTVFADGPALALGELQRVFGLSPFERDVVLLCAGVEMDGRFAELVAAAHGDETRRLPTFALALSMFPRAHWSALNPESPLRTWRIVELSGPGITSAGLRLDERILHFLAGVSGVDERLHGLVARLAASPSDSGAHDEVIAALAAHLGAGTRPRPTATGELTVAEITGSDIESRLAIAAAACAAIGSDGLLIRAADVPSSAPERFALARLVAREALLSGSAIVVDVSPDVDPSRVPLFVESLRAAPVVVSTAEHILSFAGMPVTFEVPAPTRRERLAQWQEALGPSTASLNGELSRVNAHFDLKRPAIRAIAMTLRALERAPASEPAPNLGDALWDNCRIARRPHMEGLAQRIEAIAQWEDLVLPDQPHRVLRSIASQVRQRHRVYEEWGFAEKSARGLGMTALFAGASGTGKTMAAEVLARELRLDLYRIDLARVVSKYIGETEKNLGQLFDAAEGSAAILLFDEADALFGKRSDVKDSHDRYANIEVSYLLQRMESYRGLAILTTNMRSAIDAAFVRRIRFIVQFPFPDAQHRAAIWRASFPARVKTTSLLWDRLAQLNVSGGQIRNIALSAAFVAADRDEEIGMRHLAEAAHAEYAKVERAPSDAELRGWI